MSELALTRVNLFEFLDELLEPTDKTRVLGVTDGEDFVTLACVVMIQYQRVTEGRTVGQTDSQLDRS